MYMEVTATVDSKITISKALVPDNIADEIKGSLMMKNVARETAAKERIPGWWNIPEYLQLYKEDAENLYLPRGFADQLTKGFESYGTTVSYTDNRVSSFGQYADLKSISLRDYQESAVNSILNREQGIWQAPPGAGKTVGVLEAIRRSGQKAVVVTDKTNIAEQWVLRGRAFLGTEIGIVGDGNNDECDILICIQQSLWSRRDELEASGWFNQFGFVCLDECHHLPANTFTDILARFPAKYRIGVSGTPFKLQGQDYLLEATLGPRLHITEKSSLRKEGWLVKPEVQVWKTDFTADFWPTHECHPTNGCKFKYCTRDKKKTRHQNNYSDVMAELIKDPKRNKIIAKNIAKEVKEGHSVIVLSKRLAHLDELRRIVGELTGRTDNLFSFTGRETTDIRIKIQEKTSKTGGNVLFSTIADEALDIPKLDRLHLVWPTRNTDITKQQIGRVERPFPGKKDAVINDYYDNVGPLKGQIADRVNMVYIPEGLTIRGWEDIL